MSLCLYWVRGVSEVLVHHRLCFFFCYIGFLDLVNFYLLVFHLYQRYGLFLLNDVDLCDFNDLFDHLGLFNRVGRRFGIDRTELVLVAVIIVYRERLLWR